MKTNLYGFVTLVVFCTTGVFAAELSNDPINIKGITTISETPTATPTVKVPTEPIKIETPPATQIKSEDVAKCVDEINRPEGTAGGPDIKQPSQPEHSNIPAIERGAKLDKAAPRFVETPQDTKTPIEPITQDSAQ